MTEELTLPLQTRQTLFLVRRPILRNKTKRAPKIWQVGANNFYFCTEANCAKHFVREGQERTIHQRRVHRRIKKMQLVGKAFNLNDISAYKHDNN